LSGGSKEPNVGYGNTTFAAVSLIRLRCFDTSVFFAAPLLPYITIWMRRTVAAAGDKALTSISGVCAVAAFVNRSMSLSLSGKSVSLLGFFCCSSFFFFSWIDSSSSSSIFLALRA
jgi:hypothetical protein